MITAPFSNRGIILKPSLWTTNPIRFLLNKGCVLIWSNLVEDIYKQHSYIPICDGYKHIKCCAVKWYRISSTIRWHWQQGPGHDFRSNERQPEGQASLDLGFLLHFDGQLCCLMDILTATKSCPESHSIRKWCQLSWKLKTLRHSLICPRMTDPRACLMLSPEQTFLYELTGKCLKRVCLVLTKTAALLA